MTNVAATDRNQPVKWLFADQTIGRVRPQAGYPATGRSGAVADRQAR